MPMDPVFADGGCDFLESWLLFDKIYEFEWLRISVHNWMCSFMFSILL